MLLRRESFGREWRISFLSIILGFCVCCLSYAADTQSQKTETINPKAEKYFTLLTQSPSGDYLYDRFYDAWLDTGTIEGLEAFLKQNESNSKEPSGSLLLAFFYERQGNDTESLNYFQKASSGNPNSDILFQKASVEARLLDFDSAISDLKEADKICKDKDLSIKIIKLLGRLYIRTGQKDAATDMWNKLIQSNPDDEDIYEDMIELQISEGLYEQAIETSDKLLEKTKDNYKRVMRQLRKADIYVYSGENEQALEIYSKSLELVGQGTWLENQICSQIERVFQRQDNVKELQNYWEKLIEAQPQRISIKKRLAQLLLKFSEVDKALVIFQEIVRVTPGDKQNQQAYIEALRSVSQTSKALDLMNELCRQNPDDRELLIQLADLYYLDKNSKAVTDTLEKYIDKSDKSEYIFLRVARILENYSYKSNVLEIFDKLLAQYPESLTAKEAYAEVLYRYGDKDKALDLWNTIAKAGDLQTLLRISKTVSSRGYAESSLSWLELRYDQFENDISYLNQLCEEAIRQGLFEKSKLWLEKQLAMADRFSLIQDAVRQRIFIEKNNGTIEETIKELQSQASGSIQKTCLLSELLGYYRRETEAQNVLDKFIRDANSLNIQDPARNSQKEIALQQKIHLYSINKQWDRAADCTKKLIALKGTLNSAYIRELIDLYEKASQWDLAIDWIPEWKNASPGSAEPYLAESRILRKMNKLDTAIERLRAADQVLEDNKEIMSELASLYRSTNHQAEAYRIIWRLYDEADDVSDKLGYVRDLAAISRNMGNLDRLIAKIQEQKNNNRTSAVPLLALAEVYRQTDKYEERLQALMEATRIKPDDISLLNEIARIQESEGFWEQAAETLKQAMSLDTSNATKQKLARLYIQYGSEEEGYRLLFDIADNASINPLDVQTTVQMLIAETNWDIAEAYLDEVLPKFPDDYRLHYLYAICLEENGNSREALEKFIQILEMKKEIPGNTAKSTLSQQTTYLDQINQIAPPETAEILAVQQVLSQALSYRRSYENLPYWYYPNRSRQSVNINLPKNVEDLPGFAIAHIISIINSDSEYSVFDIGAEMREAAIKRLTQEDNYSSLQFLLDANQINPENLTTSIVEMASKYPDNEAIQGLWVIYNSLDRDKDEKHVRQVFEMFKDSYPSLACMLGLTYGSAEKPDSNILSESIDIFERLKSPSDYLISRCAQVLRTPNSLLTQEQQGVVANKLMDWYDDPNLQSSQNAGTLFYYISSSILTSGNKAGLIKILNKEVENFKKRPTQSPVYITSTYNAGYQYSQARIQDLRYPPVYNLQDFPNMILQILLGSGIDNTNIPGSLFDPNNIDDFINQLKDPVLKAVVCMAANHENKALDILKEQIDAKTKSISAHIILAGLLAKQNQKDQAILVLGNVQSLKPDNTTQQLVDGAIVSYSLSIDFSQHADGLEIARKAAMRLSQGQFPQPQYRDQLIQAMNNLGLKDEARLFAKQYTSTTSNQIAMQQVVGQQTVYYQGIGNSQNLSNVQYNKIVELLQEDKKDPALRLLLSDLETIAGNSLLPEQNYNRSNSDNRISLVHAYNLEDKLVEMADPVPSRNVRKLLIFARLCDLVGRQDRAREVYGKILKDRPHEFGALLWLAFSYVDKEPNKAIEYLLAIDRRYQSQLGRQLSNYIQNNYYREGVEKTLDFASLAALFLDSLKDPDSLELSWAANIPMALANSYSRNDIRLPQLYNDSQSNSGRYEVSSKEQEDLANRRRKVHNQFCESMLRIPQLASQGFACLHAEARARNAVNDVNMSAIALNALLKYQPYRGNSQNMGLTNRYNWGTGKDKRIISPMEFLLDQNWKNGTLDELIEKTVPILEENHRSGEAKQLKLLASLYKASDENYVSQAEALLHSDIISGNPSQSAMISKESAISQIIEIRSDRSLKVNLNKFLLDQIDVTNQGRTYQVQEFVNSYLMQYAKDDPQSAKEFLENVVTVFLGPKDKRKEFISQNYSQRGAVSNSYSERINVCLNLLRNQAQNSDLLFTVLSQLGDFEGYFPDMRYYVQSGFDSVFQKAINSYSQGTPGQTDLTGFMNMLDDSPFLADVNSFETLPVAQLQKNSMYSYILYRIWQNSGNQYSDFRKQLRQSLLQRTQDKKTYQTFGTELLIAQLSDDRRQEVYDCLGRYWDKLQKLDAAKQGNISVMISDTVGIVTSQDSSLSENTKIIINRINELIQKEGQEKVNTYLKNKQFEDFQVSESQFVENTSSLISSVASYDVNSGIQIFSKAQQIIEDARNRGKFNYSSSRDLTSRLLQRMQEDSRAMGFGTLGFVVKLIRDTNEPSLNFEPYYVNQFEYSLSERFREYSNASHNNQIEALKKFYSELGPYVGKGNLAGLNIFRGIFNSGNWNEQVINEAIDWADEQAKSGDYPDLAKALNVFANFQKQQRFRNQPFRNGTSGNTGDNPLDKIEQYYSDTITDANLSLQWRIMANYSLTQSFSSAISDDLVMKAINLIIEGWSKFSSFNPEYCTNTIKKFLSLRSSETSSQDSTAMHNRSGLPLVEISNAQNVAASSSQNTVQSDWEVTAAKLSDGYMAYRQPGPVNLRPASTRTAGYTGSSSNANIQLAMLEINLILDRQDAVRTMLDSFDSSVGTYLDCWALLVKYNQPDMLKSVVEKQWSNNINQIGVVRFNKEIEKNLSGCLDVLQSPDIKYFAEVLISSLPDESGRVSRAELSRNDRLKKLAEKFGEITFNSVPIKQRILEIYVNDSQLLPLVSEYIAEEGKNINPLTLASNQNSNLTRTQSQLLAAYCVSSLLKGDPNTFTKTIQVFSVYTQQNLPSGVRQVLDTMGRQLLSYADTIQNNWTESQVSSLATGITSLISCSSQSYDPRRLISYLIVFDVIVGREDEISEALENCSANIRQNMQYYQSLSEFNRTLARFTRNRNLTMEQRIDIIKRFYQTEQVQNAMSRDNQRDMLSTLTSYNVLTRQEIEQNSDLLKNLFIQTKQIEAYLKAAGIKDIKFNLEPGNQLESRFRQYVISMLNSTMWQDTELCSKILIKTKSLFLTLNDLAHPESNQENQAQDSLSQSLGDNFISSILLQRDYNYFSLSDIGIITSLTRDANGPQIILSYEYLQRILNTINDRYRQILQDTNQGRLEAVKDLYSKIGPYFGRENASGFSAFWVNIMLNNRSDSDNDAIISWSDEQSRTGEYPKLAKEISIAAKQMKASQSNGMRRGGIPNISNESGKDMRDYYLDAITDSNLTVIWRLMALEEYRRRSQFDNYLDETNAETVFKAIPLVIEGWKLYANLPEVYYARLVSSFVKLQDKPEWKELAEKLSDAYEEFKLESKNTPTASFQENYMGGNSRGSVTSAFRGVPVSIPLPTGRGGFNIGFTTRSGATRGDPINIPSPATRIGNGMIQQFPVGLSVPAQNIITSIEQSMLEIRLVLNNDELIRKQLDDEKNSPGKTLDAWALLAQYGKDSMLKDVIEKYWQDISAQSYFSYTKEMEENIPRCLNGISREDMRYFAEVVLSSLPDSILQDHIPIVSHRERMTQLAAQYPKVGFDDQMVKQRILALLINEPDALKFVSADLTEQAAQIDLNSLFSNFNNTARDQFNLVLANCCEKLLTGDPNNFISAVKTVALNTSGSNQNTGRELINLMADNLLKTADCIKNNWSAQQMAALGSADTELFVQSNTTLNNSNSLFINHYIFFVLGDKRDELLEAYGRFSSRNNQVTQSMMRYERLPEYYAQLKSYLVTRNLSFEQRLDIIHRFHKADWIMNSWRPVTPVGRGQSIRMSPNFNIVQLLVDQGIFTRQETIDNSSSFADYVNPAVSAFLKIKNIEELGSANMQLNSYINNILSSVNLYDLDMIIKIIIKADELYQQGLREGVVDPRARMDFTDRIISQITLGGGNTYQALEFIVRLMRDTKGHDIFSNSFIIRVESDIISTYSRNPQTASMNLDTIKNLYKQIGQCTGEGNASGIGGIFCSLFSNRQWSNNSFLDSIIQWSHDETQSGDYPQLAREIEMIATVYRNRPMYGRATAQDKNRPIIEYYEKILNDENISLQWRLMAIHAIGNWLNYPGYDELMDQAMPVLIKSSMLIPSFSWDLYNNLLVRFVRSAHTGDSPDAMRQNDPGFDFSPLRSGWADSASKALASYMDNRTRMRTASMFQTRIASNSFHQSASVPELEMLEISLLLKEDDVALALLNDDDGTLKTSSSSLALLIQYRNNVLLKKYAEDNIDRIKLDTRGVYGPNLEERITESLKNISREDIRYIIKVFLYAHNSSNQPVQPSFGPGRMENIPSRSERLKKLAEQFSNVSFASDTMKKQTLTVLIQEIGTLPYISKALREQEKDVDISSIFSTSQPYTTESPDFQLFFADKMDMLLNGDPNGFLGMISFVRRNMSDPQQRGFGGNISYMLSSGFLRLITGTDWKAENIKDYLDISEELLSTFDSRGFSSTIPQLICCRVALLLLADEQSQSANEDSLKIDQATIQEIESTFEVLQQFSNIRGLESYTKVRNQDLQTSHQVLAQYMNSAKLPFEKRIAILEKFYSLEQIAAVLKDSQGNNSILSLVLSNGVLPVNEITKYEDVLVSHHFINDTSWQTLASYQAREGLLDEAESSWFKSAQISLKSENPWNMQSYLFLLNRNNLRDKALEHWRSFDTMSLSPKSLSEYNLLIQRLENQN